jgi:hypothetical protein
MAELLTTTEAAALIGCRQEAVREAILGGVLDAAKLDGFWRIQREDALAWGRTRKPSNRPSPQAFAWDRTAELLAEVGSATVEELKLLADRHAGNVRKHLAILAKLGRAERLADGQWVLTESFAHQGAA